MITSFYVGITSFVVLLVTASTGLDVPLYLRLLMIAVGTVSLAVSMVRYEMLVDRIDKLEQKQEFLETLTNLMRGHQEV